MNCIMAIAMFRLCAKGCLESLFAYLAKKRTESVLSRVAVVVSKTFRNIEIVGINTHRTLFLSIREDEPQRRTGRFSNDLNRHFRDGNTNANSRTCRSDGNT